MSPLPNIRFGCQHTVPTPQPRRRPHLPVAMRAQRSSSSLNWVWSALMMPLRISSSSSSAAGRCVKGAGVVGVRSGCFPSQKLSRHTTAQNQRQAKTTHKPAAEQAGPTHAAPARSLTVVLEVKHRGEAAGQALVEPHEVLHGLLVARQHHHQLAAPVLRLGQQQVQDLLGVFAFRLGGLLLQGLVPRPCLPSVGLAHAA